MALTDDQIAAFERDGFLVLERLIDPAACDALRARADDLVDAFDPGPVAAVFSTTSRVQDRDDYFLGSGGDVRFFFEEDAFDGDGALTRPKAQALNKFGHAMHDLDPVFDRFSRQPQIAETVRALGYADPLLLQSMYIFKPPHIGGEVVPHQDGTFLYAAPKPVLGLWFALEDASRDNACLWALPGGHLGGLKSRYARHTDGSTDMTVHDATPWDTTGGVALEVPKGTMIALHGLVPHWSGPNRSDKSRHAYTLHLLDASADYPADNWLQRPPGMPLRGF